MLILRGGRGPWRECCAKLWQKQRLERSRSKHGRPWIDSHYQNLGRSKGRFFPGFRESMTLLTLWFWTCSFQNWETMSALRSCPVCGALLQSPISPTCTDCTAHLHSFILLLIKHSWSTNHVLNLVLGVGDTVVIGHSSCPLELSTRSQVDMDWPTDKCYSSLGY